MKFNNVVIADIEAYLPDTILTSDELEYKLSPVYERLKLPEGRLELMTGIKSRRYWEPGTRPSDIATKAAAKILANHHVPIDLLIHSSVCRDFLEPATASVIHSNLELSKNCQIFDLSNACLGVLSAMTMAATQIEHGLIENALIVSGENAGPLIVETIKKLNTDSTISKKDFKKYMANLTIGSAGVAVLLSQKEKYPNAPRLLGSNTMTDSSANKLCQGSGNSSELMMETDSEALLEAGINLARMNWNETKNKLQIENKDIDWVIGHQVGIAHENLTMKAMELGQHPTHITYPHLGNTGSAALPVTLWELWKVHNKINKNDNIALLGIGSGLTSTMMHIKW